MENTMKINMYDLVADAFPNFVKEVLRERSMYLLKQKGKMTERCTYETYDKINKELSRRVAKYCMARAQDGEIAFSQDHIRPAILGILEKTETNDTPSLPRVRLRSTVIG